MKKIHYSFSLVFILIIVCIHCTNTDVKPIDLEKIKNELAALESAHQDSAAKYGFEKSLLFFASPQFVLMQDGKVITTLDSIKAQIARSSNESPNYTLTWKPDFIDVSRSGDMGYTYGYYTITFKDTTGGLQPIRGAYQTIWKKNDAGTWELVLD